MLHSVTPAARSPSLLAAVVVLISVWWGQEGCPGCPSANSEIHSSSSSKGYEQQRLQYEQHWDTACYAAPP